ncbi:MAG: ATP-binding cassette domain-containing protein [Phycisphaerales bacterium]|nr:ATP-binding cassette domain-containing protein [Phycisphaerales bacterium]
MASVQLRALSKTYGGNARVVRSVDLSIADGEFIVLVGPSGCGKSTTLRMIAGLEEISEGTVSIANRVVNAVAPKDRDIAMVFQNYALYPHLNVRQNLSFGLERRRTFKSRWRGLWDREYRTHRRTELAAIQGRVEKAARTLGIDSLLHRQPRELSGGQRQRVAVGRALVRDPAVFLFDEPLSNLDAHLRGAMRTELRILHRTLRATMVYVTHDQEEAMSLADRIVVMKDGVVQQVGTPAEVYSRPTNRFVAGFIGTPPMNMIEGRLAHATGGALTFHWNNIEIALPPDRWDPRSLPVVGEHAVTLGIRPERLSPTVVSGTGSATPTGRVVAVERYGATADFAIQLAGLLVIARVSSDACGAVQQGDEVALTIDTSSVHLFDSVSGEAIGLAAPGAATTTRR